MSKKNRDILNDIDDLLDEIDGSTNSADLIEDDQSHVNENDWNEIQKIRLQNVISEDGFVQHTTSEDKLQLFLSYYPAKGDGVELTTDTVKKYLISQGVNSLGNIDWVSVERAIKVANSSKRTVFNKLVVSGYLPKNRVPEKVYIIPEFEKKVVHSDNESEDEVDYHEYSSFIMVDEGKEIGSITPEVSGLNGVDVYGNEIPFETEKSEKWEFGKNIKLENDKIVAAKYGALVIKKCNISIEDVLNVKGNVDFSTGNIKFKGNIRISGYIQEGFTVVSKGKLFCEDSIYGANVQAKEGIWVKKGILGKEKGKIFCGGDIQTKYIENAIVSAEGNVEADNGILHSQVFCSNKVKSGKKGMIVASKIYAQNGVSCAQLGSKGGSTVEVYCGVDFVMQEKLKKIQNSQIELAQEVIKQEEILEKVTDPEERKNIASKLSAYSEYKDKLTKLTISILERLDQNETASVKVKGKIFPGAYIEICHIAYLVKNEMLAQEFYLDKSVGKVVSKPLVS